jgi:DegV family protein with EDD domain
VYIGQREYLDGVELTPEQFFRLLGTSQDLPRTQPPSANRIYAAYMRAVSLGATGILSLHTSAKLSAAVHAAREAASHVDPRLPVLVLDSAQGTTSLLPAVRFAAQMAQIGAPLDAIALGARDVLSRTQMYFLVETLEYLHRGGRIGRAQRLLGTLLDAKPILAIQQGEVVPVETVRPRQRAYERLLEIISGLGPLDEVYVGQTSDELGAEMVERLRYIYRGTIHQRWVGAGVGVHMGVGVTVAAVVSAQRTRSSRATMP